jgi:hypothetical protein
MNTQKSADRPEYGKQYVLCGKPGQKSIANGNTWQESEVKLCKTCGATLDLVYDMDEDAGWVDLYYCDHCAVFPLVQPQPSTLME